jgi:hypothetical protein
LIVRPAPFARFTALNLSQLPVATLHERSGGRGDIRFGETPFLGFGGRNAFGGWVASLDPTPQFIGIEDVRIVFNRVQSLAAPAKV